MKQVLFEVRPEKLETWRAWATELTEQGDEVKETLREEGALREICTLFIVGSKYYLYMSIEFSGTLQSTNLARELNQTHRAKIDECLLPVAKGELLYDFNINS